MVNQEALVRDAAALVRTPGLSGQEGAAARLFASQLEALGFDEVRTDAVGNVIGIIRGGRPGGRIMFEGHIDTVPEGDLSLWTRDPYGGEASGGRIWGRGTSDMKGALVAMAHGLANVIPHKSALSGELVLTAVVCEEIFEGIAFGRVLDALPPDLVVVGEATELELAIGQKGRAEVRIEVHGRSAHSSCPDKGLNAIRGFASLFHRIESLRLTEDPVLGRAVFEPVDIVSAPWPGASVIPALCRSTWDRRLLPGESVESVLGPLQTLFAEESRKQPGFEFSAEIVSAETRTWPGAMISASRFFPAWCARKDSPYIQEAQAALQSTGLTAGLRTWGFCTDGSESAGRRGIPTIGFGPSREDLAHVADEYIEIHELQAAAAGYPALALRLADFIGRMPENVRCQPGSVGEGQV